MLKVCMWSTDPVGPLMAGPGIRYHRLATELARLFDVTLVAPGDGLPGAPYAFAGVATAGWSTAHGADVVVAQSLPLGLLRGLRRRGTRLVLDLYAPALVEGAARLAHERERTDGVRYEEVVATTRLSLELGDAFLCASERQRDHWLGALACLGRVTPRVYAADPALGDLVAVVPFGLDPIPPDTLAAARQAEWPGLAPADNVLLWGGGIWNWLDPLTLIRAVGRLAERRSDVKLVFLGMAHPSAAVGTMSMAGEAVALASRLGLEGRSVLFNRSWVAYADRLGWFARADLGVSAHLDSLESRLAFRTRVLDHVAAGTPLVVTRGDVLADLVESRGLGRVVPPGDVDAWESALTALLDDPAARAAARAAVVAAQEQLAWRRAAEPLAGLLERVVAGAPRAIGGVDAAVLRAALTLARSSVGRRGVRATVTAIGRTVAGRDPG